MYTYTALLYMRLVPCMYVQEYTVSHPVFSACKAFSAGWKIFAMHKSVILYIFTPRALYFHMPLKGLHPPISVKECCSLFRHVLYGNTLLFENKTFEMQDPFKVY